MSETMWMVRAGEGAYLIDEFEKGYVAIGWNDIGDLSNVEDQEQIREIYQSVYPNEHSSKAANAVAMIYKFRVVLSEGTMVVTYNPQTRKYFVGKVVSDYMFKEGVITDYSHIRKVKWEDRIERDKLKVSSRNSLGSTLTLFNINQDVSQDIISTLSAKDSPIDAVDTVVEKEELDQLKEDTVARAHELIKDKILSLNADQMEELVAALLRAMGYKTKVMPKGPDRGVDVLASPDGLGLETPRIKAEVKHRVNTPMGSQEIRSFLGGLRENDRALYISTGGFSKDAKYEADRANIPLTLLGLDDLASLIVSHYEAFDLEGKVLIPLVRIYWPVD